MHEVLFIRKLLKPILKCKETSFVQPYLYDFASHPLCKLAFAFLFTFRIFIPYFYRKSYFFSCLWSSLVRIKPWPNGLASRRKLCLLATPFGQALRALALTCDDLRSLWSRSNLHASQGKFFTVGHPTQVNASWVTSINLLLANEMQDMSALKWVFLRLTCTCEETC